MKWETKNSLLNRLNELRDPAFVDLFDVLAKFIASVPETDDGPLPPAFEAALTNISLVIGELTNIRRQLGSELQIPAATRSLHALYALVIGGIATLTAEQIAGEISAVKNWAVLAGAHFDSLRQAAERREAELQERKIRERADAMSPADIVRDCEAQGVKLSAVGDDIQAAPYGVLNHMSRVMIHHKKAEVLKLLRSRDRIETLNPQGR